MNESRSSQPQLFSAVGWFSLAALASALLVACVQPQTDQCSSPYEADEDGSITFTPTGLHQIELAARRFWAGSRYDEPWENIAARAMEACEGGNLLEISLVSAAHPRATRETFWEARLLSALEERYQWVSSGIYSEPKCQLIREALSTTRGAATADRTRIAVRQPPTQD